MTLFDVQSFSDNHPDMDIIVDGDSDCLLVVDPETNKDVTFVLDYN